jgi:transcriptional regulator with XRE-family HTH domain
MEGILNRIKLIIEKERITPSELADSIGIGRPLLSHVLSGRNNPSLQLVLKILESYPAYSANWLLTGVDDVNTTLPPSPPEKESETVDNPIKQPEISTSHQIEKRSKPDGLPEVVLMMFNDKTYEAYKLRK